LADGADRCDGPWLAQQGFSVPLTPQGKSPLVSPPPWHYSSDCLVVEYWADPAAIAALLPPGVTPDQKSGGRTFDEIIDPARYQYRGAFVLVEALAGVVGNYNRPAQTAPKQYRRKKRSRRHRVSVERHLHGEHQPAEGARPLDSTSSRSLMSR
jgi:hypothetical protein